MQRTIKWMIAGVVSSIAALSIATALGCSTGLLKKDSCSNQPTEAFAVLTALLSTVMSLAVRTDALDEPVKPTVRRVVKPTEK